MQFLPANRLKLYRNFKAIEAQDFHGVARFYERFEDGIRALDFEEYFDCTLTYTNALFETAQYGKHVVMCDHLLETIIMQNIETWGGEDIYARVLYDKSVSLYYLQEYPASEHVLRELIKIHPDHQAYLRLLNKCLVRQKPAWLMTTRALSVALILLSSLVLALQLFVIKPFFPFGTMLPCGRIMRPWPWDLVHCWGVKFIIPGIAGTVVWDLWRWFGRGKSGKWD